MSDLLLMCWDCHKYIEEATAEQVRTNPHLTGVDEQVGDKGVCGLCSHPHGRGEPVMKHGKEQA